MPASDVKVVSYNERSYNFYQHYKIKLFIGFLLVKKILCNKNNSAS